MCCVGNMATIPHNTVNSILKLKVNVLEYNKSITMINVFTWRINLLANFKWALWKKEIIYVKETKQSYFVIKDFITQSKNLYSSL